MFKCQNCGKEVYDVEGDGFCMACSFIEPDKPYHRFYQNGERSIQYTTDAEIVAYLHQYPEDIAGWMDSMWRLALTSYSWGDMRGMGENLMHIKTVATAVKKANGEDILE
jgi:ribosomal protein L37E